MPVRSILAIHRLPAFKAWLDANGIAHRRTDAAYQVLQIQLPGDPRWHAIYKRAAAKEHLSVPDPLVSLVRDFVSNRTPAWCCDKGPAPGETVCSDCAETNAAYQSQLGPGVDPSPDTPPWE